MTKPMLPNSPGSPTFEERRFIVARLQQLKNRADRTFSAWKLEIEAVLGLTPVLSPLANVLNEIGNRGSIVADQTDKGKEFTYDPVSKEKEFEALAKAVVDAALRLIEAQPGTLQLGDGERLLIQNATEDAIWKSSAVQLARWLLPIIGVVLFGGVLYGSYKLKGIVDLAADTEAKIAQTTADVNADAAKAQAALHASQTAIQAQIDQRIKEEVSQRITALDSVFKTADSDAKAAVGTKLAEFDKQLRDLKLEYQNKSVHSFEQHQNEADAMWTASEKNWRDTADQRHRTVLTYLDGQKTHGDAILATLEQNARTSLERINQQVPDLGKRVDKLQPQLESFQTLLASEEKLTALAVQLDAVSVGGKFRTFVRLLEVKDTLAVVALVCALAALVIVFFRRRGVVG